MNRKQIAQHLLNRGRLGMEVSKAEGVWYLIGQEEHYDGSVERCLHVVRMDDITPELLDGKLTELDRSRKED